MIFLFIVFSTSFSEAQTPVKIHDLKSITDQSGTAHLFYRIYEKYEGTDYVVDNIYHYNTETGEEDLFLESFYDIRLGFPFNQTIIDYKFLNKDPENFVYTTRYCDHECSDYISRGDNEDIMGGLFVTMDHLNVEGTDSGRVYVEMLGEVIIGRNGGRDWPDVDAENFDEVPDSTKLNFPLTSLSPYNDSLMFGIDSRSDSDNNGFYRTTDKGETIDFISDTLLPKQIKYDSNSNTIYIYIFDRIGNPSSDINCTIDLCKYGIFVNNSFGKSGDWQLKKVFSSRNNTPSYPTIHVHPNQSGKIYAWNDKSILISEDYGGNFETLVDPNEEITGFSTSSSGEYFTTISTLYKIEAGNFIEIISIPVSNQPELEFPQKTELLQNYPNPFNPSTTITYKLQTAGVARLDLYNIQGQLVKELVNDFKTEGTHKFLLDGSDLSSGIYIIRAKLGIHFRSTTITLIK